MTLKERLESTIDWSKPVSEQLDKLSQYDTITHEEILELADTCHKSFQAGILLEYLGFVKLKPYWSLFMMFLQDMNWPAAGGATKMLLKAGREIIPEIQRVFRDVKDDQIWHYWILTGLVDNFERDLIIELKQDLIELINRADKEGASIQSLRILKETRILTDDQIGNYYQYLLIKYAGDKYWIDDLDREMKFTTN